MNQQKRNNLYRYGICVVILCLCTCVVLATGVSYARYRTEFLTQSFQFSTQTPQSIYLHGEVAEGQAAKAQGGDWPECPTGWTVPTMTGNQEILLPDAELRFSVSNGNSIYEYASRDQQFTVEIVAALTIENPDKLTVQMTAESPDDGELQDYIAVPERILEGSFLYGSYGDGWIYRFYDDEGEPLVFRLEGGYLNYQNFIIQVAGNVSPSLLSLEISGQYSQNH